MVDNAAEDLGVVEVGQEEVQEEDMVVGPTELMALLPKLFVGRYWGAFLMPNYVAC